MVRCASQHYSGRATVAVAYFCLNYALRYVYCCLSYLSLERTVRSAVHDATTVVQSSAVYHIQFVLCTVAEQLAAIVLIQSETVLLCIAAAGLLAWSS
jgi:hypothetical protein